MLNKTLIIIFFTGLLSFGNSFYSSLKEDSKSFLTSGITQIQVNKKEIPPIPMQENLSHFVEHEVSIYQGKFYLPKWIRHESDNEWRDELGKLVEPPEINFAGKYFVAVHSCGTDCRYYTMSDLSKGRELNALENFANTEPRPKTSDGFNYLTILYHRPNSKMLIAQYLVDLKQGQEECREKVFLFKNEKLKSITKTERKCREF